MKQSEKWLRALERNWQAVTLGIICICLTFAVVAAAQSQVAQTSASTDWGLHFGIPGATPQGPVSQEILNQYNAYYVGNTQEKVIYLTFDAGYENGYTEQILDVLKKHDVPATFFLVKHYLNTAPELVVRMAQEGHTVANHTASHPDLSKITSEEALLKELRPVEEKFKELTGKEMPKIYRPPQGKYSETNLKQAKNLGYSTVFWSVAYADWDNGKQPKPRAAVQKLNGRIHNGAIVLLHSTSKTNSEILDTLLCQWKEQGYVFKSIEELVQ